jgi:hypothetical protein
MERATRVERDDGENEEFPLLRATGWYGSLTDATFDTGLVLLSARRIGMLWFADED